MHRRYSLVGGNWSLGVSFGIPSFPGLFLYTLSLLSDHHDVTCSVPPHVLHRDGQASLKPLAKVYLSSPEVVPIRYLVTVMRKVANKLLCHRGKNDRGPLKTPSQWSSTCHAEGPVQEQKYTMYQSSRAIGTVKGLLRQGLWHEVCIC